MQRDYLEDIDPGQGGFKLKDCRLRLDIRKKFFIMRMVWHWHRFPREIVDVPIPLAVFKTGLDVALNNLVW